MNFTADEIIKDAEDKLARLRLPLPKRPQGAAEYDLPTETSTSIELGQKMLFFTGLHGYAIRKLGELDGKLAAVDAEYKLKVSTRGIDYIEGRAQRADIIEANVLKNHPEFEALIKRRTEYQVLHTRLESQVKIYELTWKGLSRELSRREMEVRAGG